MKTIPVVDPAARPLVLPPNVETSLVVGYMRGGAVVLAARTMTPNRFDPYAPPIPVTFYTDGEWVWSMEAAVGVRDYAMGLPDAFVEKVVQMWGVCPVVDEAGRMAAQQHIQASGRQR